MAAGEGAGLVPFRLVGTSAALVQGVAVPARDVDILLVSRSGLDRFASSLAGVPCRTAPVYEPLIDHLCEHGSDFPLIARAMRDRDVEATLWRRVADRLRPR